MNQHPLLVEPIVGITSDVRPFIDDERGHARFS
jgi:hypothetical protein